MAQVLNVKKHIPMVRFRYGKFRENVALPAQPLQFQSKLGLSSATPSPFKGTSFADENLPVPLRRRVQLSDATIDLINLGGAYDPPAPPKRKGK